MATTFLPEILEEINKDPKLLTTKFRGNSALRIVFEYAFLPEKKFLLPEDEPPYRPDAAPIGMSPAILTQELRRFYVFLRKDLKSIKREALFISLLESVHPSEAELILAIKDQKLHKKYKKITRKVVETAGFIAPEQPGA
jgi:hypothetical protein